MYIYIYIYICIMYSPRMSDARSMFIVVRHATVPDTRSIIAMLATRSEIHIYIYIYNVLTADVGCEIDFHSLSARERVILAHATPLDAR